MALNSGQIKKGQRLSPDTEFKKGSIPWNINGMPMLKGSGHPQWKGGKPKCLDCGIGLKTYATKHCRKCYLENYIQNHVKDMTKNRRSYAGKNHPLWKGGITPKNTLLRTKFRREVQPLVFARDNYTCQICSQYGQYLQVDHIKSWAKYPDLRFNLDNCRTLCMACHYYVTFKRKLPSGVVWGHNFSQRIV